jgi:hypothetical protein
VFEPARGEDGLGMRLEGRLGRAGDVKDGEGAVIGCGEVGLRPAGNVDVRYPVLVGDGGDEGGRKNGFDVFQLQRGFLGYCQLQRKLSTQRKTDL